MTPAITSIRRRHGEHGASPLSARTRHRLLRILLERAEAGDAAAAGELVRIGHALDADRAHRAQVRGDGPAINTVRASSRNLASRSGKVGRSSPSRVRECS
jgi:hypothetical protein